MLRGALSMRGTEKHYRLLWFALVLAFLGHDALMAAEARTLGHHESDAVMRHAPPDAMPVTQGKLFLTYGDHAEDCASTRNAAPRFDEDPGLGLKGSDIFSVALGTLFAVPAQAWWHEPTAPPGVRRALFQVFRI